AHAWRSVARRAIGDGNCKHHRDQRADGRDVDGVPDRPAEPADVAPVRRHHTYCEIVRLLRGVEHEGPDRAFGDKLKAIDEQRGGGEPAGPDHELRAALATPPNL